MTEELIAHSNAINDQTDRIKQEVIKSEISNQNLTQIMGTIILFGCLLFLFFICRFILQHGFQFLLLHDKLVLIHLNLVHFLFPVKLHLLVKLSHPFLKLVSRRLVNRLLNAISSHGLQCLSLQ